MSRHGLEALLTNPVYIGWWIILGDIVSRNNHEPIIDTEHAYLFWYAFNRLSEYTVDGDKNEERIRLQEPRRFYQRETEDGEGLLKDRITTPSGSVHVRPDNGIYRYVILQPQKVLVKVDTGLAVGIIDTPFTERFFAHLQDTHDFDVFRQWANDVINRQSTLTNTITTQLDEIERQQEAIIDDRLAIRIHINQQVKTALSLDLTQDEEILKIRFEKEASQDLERLRKRSEKTYQFGKRVMRQTSNRRRRRAAAKSQKIC